MTDRVEGEAMTDTKTVKSSTGNLLGRLMKTTDIERFIGMNCENMKLPSFHSYITERCAELGELPERIANRAGIESSYCHQIFKSTRKPSRDKVLQLAFGFGFNFEDTQTLLKIAQHSLLYPKIKRDAVVIFCLNRKRSMIETQTLLQELGLKLLGGECE